ncbi:MAG: transglutaminase family protein [Rhodospirillaceae bacterium]|nr:transglutaminase family protein [Rhodospirillaceae bacterium]
MKRYAVRHETRYTYSLPVDIGMHIARLSPVNNALQRRIEHSLDVTPTPAWAMAFSDHFGNGLHHFSIETAHTEFAVVQKTLVEVTAPTWTPESAAPAWETVRDGLRADAFPEYPEAAEFIYASPLVPIDPAATAYAAGSFAPGATMIAAAFDLAKRIKQDFAYAPGSTTITTPVSEIMERRHGVCQDFTHAMLSGLRGLGLPARYVSGYLKTHAAQPQPDAKPDEKLVGADASHAWVSVWCGPEIGWLEFDPTNALMVAEEHIAVAYGRDFTDVTPLRGLITGGGGHTLTVAVKVEALN